LYYLTLYTDNLLRTNTILTQYTKNTTVTRHTNNITTLSSVRQATEADWLTRARDSTCAEASKTRPPSFVRRTLAHFVACCDGKHPQKSTDRHFFRSKRKIKRRIICYRLLHSNIDICKDQFST
jgi:hypothetical protein